MKKLSILVCTLTLAALIAAIVYVKTVPEQGDSKLLPIAGEYAEDVTVEQDVRYSASVTQGLLDVAYQKTGEKKPLLVFVHGGSWIGGKKEEMNSLMYTFSSRGYVTASVSYDVLDIERAYAGDCHSINDEEQDINKAVEYLVKNADTFEIDVDQIVLIGHSAGAQLVGNLTEKIAVASSEYLYSPAALVMLAPPSDFKNYVFHNSEIPGYEGSLVQYSFIFDGVYGTDVMDEIEKVDILCNLTEMIPSTLIVQGLKDTIVPPVLSEKLYEKMKTMGIDVEYKELKDADHQVIRNEAVYGTLDDFLERHLEGEGGK